MKLLHSEVLGNGIDVLKVFLNRVRSSGHGRTTGARLLKGDSLIFA